MAFERDFVERFKEEGRSALINYHKSLKNLHLGMIPVVNALAVSPRAGDQRYTQHFTTLSQREEHNLMSLVGPPDRADHEMVSVTPQVAAMLYGAYAGYNAARTEQLRPTAPPEIIAHLMKVTALLECMAEKAQTATGKVTVPSALLNLGYDTVLAEVDHAAYEIAMAHA